MFKKIKSKASDLGDKVSTNVKSASETISTKVSNKVDQIKEDRKEKALIIPTANQLAIKGGFVLFVGNNSENQYVQGLKPSANYKHLTPVESTFPLDIARVQVGEDHVFWLTKDNKIYYSGSNKSGQLGAMTPAQPDSLVQFTNSKLSIRDIVCGQHHTVFLCDKGAIFSTGKADMLGIRVEENKYTPQPIDFFKNKKITLYATGPHHSFALDESNSLYGWGRSDLLGQGQFVKVKSINVQKKEPSIIEHPLLINHKIVSIACGYEHTLCLTEGGQVYSWGRGEEGQLGNNVKETRQSPILADTLKSFKIKSISAGQFNSALITTDNECYVWGQYFKSIMQPEELNILKTPIKNVQQISQNGTYNIVLTNSNDVYTFGSDYKQATELNWTPTKFKIDDPFLLSKKITQVVASSSNSYVIVYEGMNMEPKYTMNYNSGDDKSKATLQALPQSQYQKNMAALLAKPTKSPPTTSTTTTTTSTTDQMKKMSIHDIDSDKEDDSDEESVM